MFGVLIGEERFPASKPVKSVETREPRESEAYKQVNTCMPSSL